MEHSEAIKLARKIKALVDHESTPDGERESAKARLQEVMKAHNITEEDLVREPLEPDLPAEATYDQIWESILAQVGVPEEEFHRVLGKSVSGLLGKVWFVGELLKSEQSHTMLGKGITDMVLTLIKKDKL